MKWVDSIPQYIIIQTLYNKNGQTELHHLEVKEHHEVRDLLQRLQPQEQATCHYLLHAPYGLQGVYGQFGA